MTYRRTEKVNKKAEERQRSILQAAKEEFILKGFHGASIKEIAHKAKVSIGSVYLYITNKDELFHYLVKEAYDMVFNHIVEARKKVTGGREKIIASMESSLEVLQENSDLARVLLLQSPDGDSGAQMDAILQRLAAYVEEDVLECIENGELPPQDAHIAALAFIGTFYHVVISWLKEGVPADLRTVQKSLLEYNLRGLGFQLKGE